MVTIQYPYPIATRISISKERRIRLPKFLGFPVPFVLMEDTRADQPWLGLCGLDSLAGLNAECGSLRVVAEYWAMRRTAIRSSIEKCSPTPNISSITPISASWPASPMSATKPGVAGPTMMPASR